MPASRRAFANGRPGTEMPPFKGALSDADDRAAVIALPPQAGRARDRRAPRARRARSARRSRASVHTFTFEVVAEGLEHAVGPRLPARRPSARHRTSGHFADRRARAAAVEAGRRAAGGLDRSRMAACSTSRSDPAYERTGWIYLSYAEPGANNTSMTAIVRGRIRADAGSISRRSSTPPPEQFYDAERRTTARASSSIARVTCSTRSAIAGTRPRRRTCHGPNGKLHRINPDGTSPRTTRSRDAPERSARSGATGIAIRRGWRSIRSPARLWEAEHGPTGGDELNRIEPGHNYGWPLVTSGKMYGRGADAAAAAGRRLRARCAGHLMDADDCPERHRVLHRRSLPALEEPPVRHRPRRRSAPPPRDRRRSRRARGDRCSRDSAACAMSLPGPDGLLYVALNIPGVRLSDTTPGLIVRLVPGRTRGSPSP